MRAGDYFSAGSRLVAVLFGATILPKNTYRADIVTLDAKVLFSRKDAKEREEVMIVAPGRDELPRPFVSILSPLGLALIGREVDDIAKVNTPFGKCEQLKVVGIEHESNHHLRRLAYGT